MEYVHNTNTIINNAPDLVARERYWPKIFRSPAFFQLLADFVACGLSIALYVLIRKWLAPDSFWVRPNINFFLSVNVVLTCFWLIVFWMSGLYKNWYIRSPFDEFFTIIKITFIGCALLLISVFLDSSDVQRENIRFVIVLYWGLLCFSVCLGRLLARGLQRRLREKGRIRVRTILVGDPGSIHKLIESVEKAPAWGYDISGVVLSHEKDVVDWIDNHSREKFGLLGTAENIKPVLERYRPEEVLVSLKNPEHDVLMELAADCDERGVIIKIVPDIYEIFSGQARTLQIYGSPLIEINPQLMKPWEEAAKRMLDILVSVVVLAGGLPVWLVTALLIKMESPGRVFFVQKRVGKSHRVFNLYKFRSMVSDSEKNGPQWTQVNDPRVTKLGKFLRKSHIDEIPQFINVLKGEMSVVGPRPEQPFYVDKYSQILPYYSRRLKVRPGITGWWQVKYKSYIESTEEIENRLKYDFFYIENISFKLDLEIMVRTLICMVRGHGQT